MPTPPNETEWILLRKIPFQENSLIVNGLSISYGRVDLLLKGARAVGKKRFPEAELFREFSVIYQEPRGRDGLATARSWEMTACHDMIAERTENYLASCGLAGFLLRNTKPMLPVEMTYRALKAYLCRMGSEREPEPYRSLVRFVFLYENGFLSSGAAGTEENAGVTEKLLAFALDPVKKLPADKTGYWKRFCAWIDNLCTYNGLDKAPLHIG